MTGKGRAKKPPFAACVFVNCAFDQKFVKLLHPLIFTIHDCGFVARLAVEPSDANEARLDKITRLIKESRLSIHDMSTVSTSTKSLPRFNMPLECGMALGAIRFGTKSATPRDLLFMTAVPFQGQRTLSDLGGLDPIAHQADPKILIEKVRHWLAAKTSERTRGGQAIYDRYVAFMAALPQLAKAGNFKVSEIKRFDYLNDWSFLMSTWLATEKTKAP